MRAARTTGQHRERDLRGAVGPRRGSVNTVILVGPPPTMVGGMASVVEQILALAFGGRYKVELFPITVGPDDDEPLSRRVARHIAHLRSLARIIRRRRASIVHLHTCSGFSFYRSVADLILVRWLGCRAVLHIHGARFDEFYARVGWVQRRLIAGALARADRVIALSAAWRGKLAAMAPAARLVVVENAVVGPAELPSRRHDGPCRFLLMARMDDWKGVDDLLEACAALRAAKGAFELVLAGPPGTAGDGPVLAEKIRSRGLESSVRYVGPVRGAEKSDLLRWADVYVQPSHYEGMPISLLEALAYRLPVVATKVGAVPEVVADGVQGFLVPPRDPARLSAALSEMARDACRRQVLSDAAARLAASRFASKRFRDDLVDLYDGVCADVPNARLTRLRTRALPCRWPY